MQNWKLTLEYDGTDFAGWQSQPNGRTVQDVVEAGIRQISGESVRIAGAGRTDAGVHALGQVASVALERPFDPRTLHRSLNGVLPEDVVVMAVEPVDQSFHARFSARRRSYRYVIHQRPGAIERRYVWHCTYVLDESVLHKSAAALIGEHDFQSFSKVDTDADHFRCTVQRADWRRTEAGWIFEITADRFLYGMVRTLVGTMVDMARGYRASDEMLTILAARDRRAAGMSAPAKGLFFMSVVYEGT